MTPHSSLPPLAAMLVVAGTLVLSMSSCQTPQPEGVDKLREEMNDRKLKRVTSGMVQEYGLRFGSTVADSIQSHFVHAVAQLPSGASCIPVFDTVASFQAQELKAKVMRLPFWKTDTTTLPDAKLRDLYAAYQYSANEGQALEANVQKLADTAFWITSPVIAVNQCMRCHQDVNGKAIKAGDAIGVYALKITRQEIIRHVDIKDLKARTAAKG